MSFILGNLRQFFIERHKGTQSTKQEEEEVEVKKGVVDNRLNTLLPKTREYRGYIRLSPPPYETNTTDNIQEKGED